MAGTPCHLHVFSRKHPSSSSSPPSTLNFMKLKTLIQTVVFSRLYRIVRALSRAKSILLHILKDFHGMHLLQQLPMFTKKSKSNKKKKKLFRGSFRLHYNWCSSHVVPVPTPPINVCYDSACNSIISTACGESGLSGYLDWLEEKGNYEEPRAKNGDDIDRIAEMFIADCHERFRLEKVESDRRFQEMLDRSV